MEITITIQLEHCQIGICHQHVSLKFTILGKHPMLGP